MLFQRGESGINSLNFHDEVFFDKMPKSKEPNDEVGDKHNDSNTNTFANLESVSNKGDKNRSAPSEQDMVDILPIVYLPVRGKKVRYPGYFLINAMR
ncbi:hypothetical protein Tco_1080837 [Tanacetum coccineum]|uniref:Uncharacterized protein n=1 Tax=Tanacetum coccineum TaxID=301880 RepID=A0ABQ5HXG3_9ASTR